MSDGSFAGAWRLPTATELMAMVESAKKQGFTNPSLTNGAGIAQWSAGQPFANVSSGHYWSSTTGADLTDGAWQISLWTGVMDSSSKSSTFYVWPVRGGQSGSFGSLTIE